MGAGASLVEEELKKPVDASDVATPRGESAKAEVTRLRTLLAEQMPQEEQALHMTLIVWNFKELEKATAWFDNFKSSEDGFPETAEAPGITVCRLYVDAARQASPGFYEEWVSQEAQTKYAIDRFKTGFMNRWFDVDPETKAFRNLIKDADRDPSAGLARTAINGTLIRGAVATPGKASSNAVACSEVYGFASEEAADAWIGAFSAPGGGFDTLAQSAALAKLFRDDKDAATCGIYTEWPDAEAQKQSMAARAGDIEEIKKALKEGAPAEIHVYNMAMSDGKDGAIL